jgi:hypothetical protein
VLRHPLVVGAALAILSGLLASLVIPGLTRVWQDRPNELALKEAIVERISQAATETIAQAASLASTDSRTMRAGAVRTAADELNRRWMVESAGVSSQVNTYFRDSAVAGEWEAFSEAVSQFILYARAGGDREPDRAKAERLRDLTTSVATTTFGNAEDEGARATFVRIPSGSGLSALTDVLRAWQEDVVTQILDSNAYGFSHGFWIFH